MPGFRNTRRENRLEELGRVDAERGSTEKSKINLREEKDRIRRELQRAEGPKPTAKARMSKAVGGSVAGRAGRQLMTPDRKRKPKKLTGDHPLIKAMAGGVKGKPHSSKEGRMSAAVRKFDRMAKAKKGLGKKAGPSPEDLQRIRDKMKKPKQMQPLRKGGSAKKPRPHGPHMWVKGDRVKKRGGGLSHAQQHYVQHGYGPHKSSGKVLKGKKIGIQIK